MEPQVGPFAGKNSAQEKKSKATESPDSKKGDPPKDPTRPLDDGTIGKATPAKKQPRGKPFSTQRQQLLKDVAKRLVKALAQHKAAQKESRRLGELVRTLDGLLLEEVCSNTELLDFAGAEKAAAAREKKAAAKERKAGAKKGAKKKATVKKKSA